MVVPGFEAADGPEPGRRQPIGGRGRAFAGEKALPREAVFGAEQDSQPVLENQIVRGREDGEAGNRLARPETPPFGIDGYAQTGTSHEESDGRKASTFRADGIGVRRRSSGVVRYEGEPGVPQPEHDEKMRYDVGLPRSPPGQGTDSLLGRVIGEKIEGFFQDSPTGPFPPTQFPGERPGLPAVCEDEPPGSPGKVIGGNAPPGDGLGKIPTCGFAEFPNGNFRKNLHRLVAAKIPHAFQQQ